MKITIGIASSLMLAAIVSQAQNPLHIPPKLTGPVFNLNVQEGTKSFYPGTVTPTFGINGVWMSPTIEVNTGDSVTLNVINTLTEKTTMHWHGLHVAPSNDGGPHQPIAPSTTWSPSFKIRNHAGTFWYHPHGEGQTDPQVSKGLAGLFIIRDPQEQALAIPKDYGVDDIPLVVQSKAFDVLQQVAIASGMDTAVFVNGTLNAYVDLPAQVIRFRLLNGSSLRSFYFGLSNAQSFYQIGTDGGLLDKPLSQTRLLLSPGERAEILIDLSGMAGNTIFLKSYASEMLPGIYGADSVGSGADTIHDYDDNFLNGADFDVLQLNVIAANSNPVTGIPSSLVTVTPFDPAMATKNRTIVLDTIGLLPGETPNRAEGPFGLNHQVFHMDTINEVVYLNTTEIWTLVNNTLVAHPFHIHDIQFNVIEENGISIPPAQRGWKDVVLVMPGESVKFLTKFETFTDPHVPYMYHCHLLHHEDDGMMGSFVVVDSSVLLSVDELHLSHEVKIYPNPASEYVKIAFPDPGVQSDVVIIVRDMLGRELYSTVTSSMVPQVPTPGWPNGVYQLSAVRNGIHYSGRFLIQNY